MTRNQSKILATLTSANGVGVDVWGHPNTWRLLRNYITGDRGLLEKKHKNHVNPLKWTTLKRTTIIQDDYINLEASECQLPSGKTISPFYVNHLNDFVVIIAVTEDGEMLVEWQYRHGVERVLLEVPAGAVEQGEEPETAACRELMEETGYQAASMEFLFKIAPNASNTSNYAWCYLAQGAVLSGCQHLDETEELEVLTVPLADVRRMLQEGKFEQAVHVAALYRALEVLGV